MKLILTDPRPEIQGAWKAQFVELPDVEIRGEPLLETAADSFLLPGNAFGFLDGGLALQVSEAYGWEVEEELRRRIRDEHHGELLVGQAIVLRLPSLPRPMIYAPIWRAPRKLAPTINVFLAVRGALLALRGDAAAPPVASVALPAIGADGGDLDPRVSARQVRYAFEMATGLRGLGDKNLTQQLRRERKLMSIPGLGREAAEETAEGGE